MGWKEVKIKTVAIFFTNSFTSSNSAFLQVQNLKFTFGNSTYPNIEARCAAFSLMFFLWNSLFAMVWALFCSDSQGRTAKKREREISVKTTSINRTQKFVERLLTVLTQPTVNREQASKTTVHRLWRSLETERKRSCLSPVSFSPPGAEDAQALQKVQMQQNRQMRDFQRFLTHWAGGLFWAQSLLSWPYDQNLLKTVGVPWPRAHS